MKKLVVLLALVALPGCALFRSSTPMPPQVAEYVAKAQKGVLLAQSGEQTAEAVEALLVLRGAVTTDQDAKFVAAVKVADAIFAKANDELSKAKTVADAQSVAAGIRQALVEVAAQAPDQKVKDAISNVLAFYDVFVALQ